MAVRHIYDDWFRSELRLLGLCNGDASDGDRLCDLDRYRASGGAIAGMLAYGESKDWKRIVFICMVLGAAIGLKLVS